MAKKGFLRIPNALLEDPELSLVECVVLSRVMSFPDGYMGTHRHLGNSVKLSKVPERSPLSSWSLWYIGAIREIAG